MTISRSFLLRERNISDKIVKKIITHILCSVFLVPKIVSFFEIMCRNIVEPDRP